MKNAEKEAQAPRGINSGGNKTLTMNSGMSAVYVDCGEGSLGQ